jgi:hypothetical protein
MKPKPLEIIGVVDPSGAGGGQVPPEKTWTLLFSVQPWRCRGGAIEETELGLAMGGLSQRKLDNLMDAIEPYAVVRMRVRLHKKPTKAGGLRGDLVKLLGETDADPELSARALSLQKPTRVKHPFLGAFTLERRYNWYAGKCKWGTRKIELCLSLDDCKDEAALFRTAEQLVKQQRTWDRKIRDCAARKLLELKNDVWLGEGEKPISANRFKNRITLESITVSAGGRLEFSFDDGNLFWGHVIQVWGTLKAGPRDADIAG